MSSRLAQFGMRSSRRQSLAVALSVYLLLGWAVVSGLMTETLTAQQTFVLATKDPGKVGPLPGAIHAAPMPLEERLKRGLVPVRGFVSTGVSGGSIYSGNGVMTAEMMGEPLEEDVIFHHEKVMQPWKRPFEAPQIASVLPEVKRLILAGEYREGLELSLHAATEAGMAPGLYNHSTIQPFRLHLSLHAAGAPAHYLRSVDFESGELQAHWTDERGEWIRRTFVSRPDHVAVQLLSAPAGQLLNTTISIATEGKSYGEDNAASAIRYERDFTAKRLLVTGHFGPEFGNIGFAGVTRIVLDGGEATMRVGKLEIRGARGVTLLTRIESMADFQQAQVEAMVREVDALPVAYSVLLARQRAVQSPIIDRVRMDFGGSGQRGLSSEELLSDQQGREGYSPALLEQIFDMGRYWLLAEGTGDDPSMAGHLNINVNLQIAPAAMGDLPEASDTFSRWMEGLMPDSRVNAHNIFGARGALVAVHPDQQQGVLYHFAFNWPHHYWISAGGWAYSPLWDHYLVTNDRDFLRDHVVPQLKEFALFYEDFLTEKDKDGNYIFVPSYSPENWPSNTDAAPTVMNAVMDISVCKEVFAHLIQASAILGTDADKVPQWQAMLDKMPPYLLDADGALKEWAWPTLEENQDHRHISHLYGVWPGDEITPETTPLLAKGAWLANRKRAQGNASGHGISHRALAAARLKDDYLVNMELKQFLEQGYVGPTLRTAHNPYTGPMPDQQGSLPTIMMEMLVYSRPGVIELLPALPASLTHGSVKGILARTFARVDELTWDMNMRTALLTMTAERDEDVTLQVRHGIESLDAPAGVLMERPAPGATRCVVHLHKGVPVTMHIGLGSKRPSDWVRDVAANAVPQ